MERIASFCVDHTRLERGMYISRVDGDVVTYDIRMKKPNQGDYLANGALHTIEHLFATYARNSVWPRASSMSAHGLAAPGSICSPAACPRRRHPAGAGQLSLYGRIMRAISPAPPN
ncbi:MAG: S-ribosylhomocysteine lyase [Ruthenibacterium lactatiformans]